MNKCAHSGSMFMSTNGSVFVSVEALNPATLQYAIKPLILFSSIGKPPFGLRLIKFGFLMLLPYFQKLINLSFPNCGVCGLCHTNKDW